MLGRVLSALSLIAAAACSGGAPPVSGQKPVSQHSENTPENAAACFARLDRLQGMKYRKLDPHVEGQCGYENAVLLLDIGVPVAGLKAVSCPVAESLYRWVHEGVRPAARDHFGADVVRIQSYGTYACRTRNSQPGARLSEHARANAVDIASFTLANGRTVAVKSGWRGAADEQSFLRAAHRAGCARFNIVIGPEGDAFHQDHLHLDMGRGPYCR